jgi:hypothetical protein
MTINLSISWKDPLRGTPRSSESASLIQAPMTPSHPSIILIPYHFVSRDSLIKNTCIFPGLPVDSAGPTLSSHNHNIYTLIE